ncbi:MAG: STAS domain-containing protein [Methylococcales bacterium]|nr:STAS domain-containing protein [Methylococcales bacterium]
MKIESKNVNNTLVLILQEKRLDASQAVSLKDEISEYIKADNQNIAINLHTVEFVDSSSLGALVSCLKLMGSRGRLTLFGLNKPVISMFKLTRMDRVFTLCETEEQALEALEA